MKKLKKRNGSGMIALALMMCVIVSIMALSSVQLTNSIFSSLNANQIALQAQQYAESKAELIKNTDYKNLKGQEKKNIPGTIFSDEVIIEAETDVPGQTNIKQKIVNIKVYKENESLPRINLAVPRTTASVTAAGGTMIRSGINTLSFKSDGNYKYITLLASGKFTPTDGYWTGTVIYNITANGSILGTLTLTTTTAKGGSSGHYWGTTEVVTNQNTIATTIVKDSIININIKSSSRLNTSTVTVFLSN